MFNTLNVKEMMNVNGGFYYVPKYRDGEYKGLVQVANNWGNTGYKCYIFSYSQGKYVASRKYPWE
jgi:bacteriocin-like protein